MGFFHAKHEEFSIRGRKKLPLRGRRLKLLRQFEVGHVYTFPQYWRLDLPDDCSLEEAAHDHRRNY